MSIVSKLKILHLSGKLDISTWFLSSSKWQYLFIAVLVFSKLFLILNIQSVFVAQFIQNSYLYTTEKPKNFIKYWTNWCSLIFLRWPIICSFFQLIDTIFNVSVCFYQRRTSFDPTLKNSSWCVITICKVISIVTPIPICVIIQIEVELFIQVYEKRFELSYFLCSFPYMIYCIWEITWIINIYFFESCQTTFSVSSIMYFSFSSG